jgi:hypothetical protein
VGVRVGPVLQPVPLAAAPHISEHPSVAERLIAVAALPHLVVVASYWIHRVPPSRLPEQAPGLPGVIEARIQFFWQVAGVQGDVATTTCAARRPE